jgi:hypothetical protein
MQIIKRKIVPCVYEERIQAPLFIREEYRPGIGTVAIFTDGEVVIEPHPDYVRSSRLIDAIFERSGKQLEQSKKRYKHVIDKDNIIRYVA